MNPNFKRDFHTEELCAWADLKLGFVNEYFNILRLNHIDGESFLNLDLNKLKEMGMEVIGHRLRFFRLVLKQRRKLNLQN